MIKCITEQDNWIVFLKEFYFVLCLSNCVQLWSWKSGIRTGIVCNRRNCAIVCTLHRNGVCACGFHGQPPLHLLVSIVQSFCPHPPPQTNHLQTLQFFVTNPAPQSNTLKSILTPRLFTAKAFLTFLSAPRPTSIFGFKPLKYNLSHSLLVKFQIGKMVRHCIKIQIQIFRGSYLC